VIVTFLRSPLVSGIMHLWQWLERYPAPEKIMWTRRCWVAFGAVTLATVLFCGYFILYLIQGHEAYQTNAEDLGIMDQALWNTVHGQFLHQTICNILSDANCVGEAGFVRFAIHFEPILLPISLLYLVFPDPRTLLVLQTVVVALGAYPAFLLARRRLQHTCPAVMLALLYLLYPAQQQATVADFHAVTFTSTLLLFTIYFMYVRRTLWILVFAFLAMACKEEISLVIMMLGFWSIILQHRWRSGLVLAVVGLLWFFLAVDVIMPYFSPTGHPLLITRFDALGSGPLQIACSIVCHPLVFLRQYVFESGHRAYLRLLFIPALFLPLLAPWVTVIALPSLLLNLASSQSQMYSGLFHYNAEIVPILLFATIEAIVVLIHLVRHAVRLSRGGIWESVGAAACPCPGSSRHGQGRRGNGLSLPSAPTEYPSSFSKYLPLKGRRIWRVDLICLMALLGLTLASSLHYDFTFHGNLPFSTNFAWPTVSPHVVRIQQFVHIIPPTVSVSAQSHLVPHISERRDIYLFPYASDSAEYIFLDTTGDIYPYNDSGAYERAIRVVLSSGQYGVLAWDDGLLLLKRGLPPPTTVGAWACPRPGSP
jgi:uncharacterized membrane protein